MTTVATETTARILEEKIASRRARVGIVGLGYVGLPLAVEFAKAGFSVTGIDLHAGKTARVNAGDSYVGDISSAALSKLVQEGKLRATTDFAAVRDLDTINICVPTPLRKTKDPDMSYIVSSCEEILKYLPRRHAHYPGIDHVSRHYRRAAAPHVRKIRPARGAGFLPVLFARTGRSRQSEVQTANIPKVVGGTTAACTEMGRLFYAQALASVVPVSSTQVAEMVKLLENTFRMINIGLVNEMALMCDRMGINVWEVIEAAATKPFGFMPFYPGPGLGGHCIPIDPFYLSWKTKQAGIEARFIELAGYINGQMPHFVVDKIQNALNDAGKPVKGSHIHILGVAYKKDIEDLRESPALDVMLLLKRRGARLTYSDPYVPQLQLDGEDLHAQPEALAGEADCAAIITDHSSFDYPLIAAQARLIVDTRNALKGVNLAT
jgi:UDP-N-acetyl-D-glucosamine dehydrogenase